MNSEQLLIARNLLIDLTNNDRKFAAGRTCDGSAIEYNDSKYPTDVITHLLEKNLIVLVESIRIDDWYITDIFKDTELGSLVAWFKSLTDAESEPDIKSIGNAIFSKMNKYDDQEVSELIKFLTAEEQEAYSKFYLNQTQELITGRGKDASKTVEEVQEMRHTLINMFELSVLLGARGTSPTRTNSYVLNKCMEELGELSVEVQIEGGLSYKDAGEDGVAGEAVDVAICAMDMFALQYPDLSPEELNLKFINYMNKKLNKWKQTLGN